MQERHYDYDEDYDYDKDEEELDGDDEQFDELEEDEEELGFEAAMDRLWWGTEYQIAEIQSEAKIRKEQERYTPQSHLIAEAEALERRGEYAEAIQLLKRRVPQILHTHAQVPEKDVLRRLYAGHIRALLRNRLFQEVIDLGQTLYAENAHSATTRIVLARVYRMPVPIQAGHTFRSAYSFGDETYLSVQRFEKAIELTRQVVSQTPGHPYFNVELGASYIAYAVACWGWHTNKKTRKLPWRQIHREKPIAQMHGCLLNAVDMLEVAHGVAPQDIGIAAGIRNIITTLQHSGVLDQAPPGVRQRFEAIDPSQRVIRALPQKPKKPKLRMLLGG